MNSLDIEKRLVNWFKVMTDKYSWLSFRYEFSQKLGVYIVGFYPTTKVDECEDFCIDALNFEDEMNILYGDDAPLFGNEECCFRFSENSKIYPTPIFEEFDYIQYPQIIFTNSFSKSFEQEDNYYLAA